METFARKKRESSSASDGESQGLAIGSDQTSDSIIFVLGAVLTLPSAMYWISICPWGVFLK